MNARAAWRLERLGFPRVYRYAPGEADWLAAGLPTEGHLANTPRAGGVARRDVPTCSPDDRVVDAAERTRKVGWDTCIVVNDERVVLGRLRGPALDTTDQRQVDEVMEEGPTTTRADDALEALVSRMRPRHVPVILVTDPDGRLIGLLRLEDAERALAHLPTG
jgi:CBS domain-containing protein